MKYLPHNFQCNTIHSSCNTTVHLLCIIFQRTYLQTFVPKHMQHSTVALSTITLTAAHNSYRSNTQQAVPNTTHKVSVSATGCLHLKYCAFMPYLRTRNVPVTQTKYALILLTGILTATLHSVLGISFCAGENFMAVLHILPTMLHFFQAVYFSHTLAKLHFLGAFTLSR